MLQPPIPLEWTAYWKLGEGGLSFRRGCPITSMVVLYPWVRQLQRPAGQRCDPQGERRHDQHRAGALSAARQVVPAVYRRGSQDRGDSFKDSAARGGPEDQGSVYYEADNGRVRVI